MSRYENPIYCPECGEILCLWLAITEQWECIRCNWRGRQPVKPKDTGLPQ